MKKLNEKYRGSDFNNYRGSYTRFSVVNQYFLKTVENALGYPSDTSISKEPANVESWGRFSFPGENANTYEVTVIAPDFYEILANEDTVKIWRGAGEEEFLSDLEDALSFH